jgi:molybdopterin/thiamine biosynthesis adenylyltransferase
MLSEKQKIRYERQIRKIGESGQEQLLSKKVVQIGAGGLGSPLAYYLVAAGIGNLTIIDYDTVSLSNLNRQILFTTDDIDKYKADIALKRLAPLNPDVKITAIREKITYDNYSKFCKDADYLIDASDNMNTKFLVNDIGLKLNIPFTIAGVQNMEGQIISVDPHKTACYRCVFGEPKKESTNEKDKTEDKSKKEKLGVIGVTPGVLGTMEAAEVIKGLLGIGYRLLNTLFMVDLENMKTMNVKLERNEKCICSK